jgi:MOSC domain-containing protein YiiM
LRFARQMVDQERCRSGRTGTTGNRVGSNVSRVRIPLSPPSGLWHLPFAIYHGVRHQALAFSRASTAPCPLFESFGDTLRIVSVNVALPVSVPGTARGTVNTGIYKQPVSGPVGVFSSNLAGDGQGDTQNHGGPLKVVYAYAAEDYGYWRQQEGLAIPSFGWFGENLTVEGVPSDQVRLGDLWKAGTALLQVTEPRSPCYKLDHKVGIPRFAARFQRSGRVGFYLRVIREGSLTTGADITLVESTPGAMTVRELSDYRHYGTGGQSLAARIISLEHVGTEWQRRARRVADGAMVGQR